MTFFKYIIILIIKRITFAKNLFKKILLNFQSLSLLLLPSYLK